MLHTGDHKLIPIQFELIPERHQISQCEDHPNHLLDEICELCGHMFCNRCVVKATQCPVGMYCNFLSPSYLFMVMCVSVL